MTSLKFEKKEKIMLTVFGSESFALQFIGLVLRFFLETTGTRSQFVFFFATFASSAEGHFTDRCQVVDYLTQLIEFFTDSRQFFRVGC